MNTFDSKKYWENRLNNNFSLKSVGYIGLGDAYNMWLYKVRKNVFMRLANSLSIDFQNAEVIDIGSGTGFYIELWKSLGVYKVVGTDITDVAINKLASKFTKNDFYQLDISSNLNNIPFKKYNIVSAIDVLFHIVDDNFYRQAIKNISNLLDEDGLFIFSENFLHYETQKGKHQVSRSLDEIENLLAENNFQILQRLPMQVIMNFPVDTTNIIVKQLWQLMVLPAKFNNLLGFILGGCLYPFEVFLASILKESPSTEIMVCRKKQN